MQSISPEIIFRGNDAWEKAIPQIIKVTKNYFLVQTSDYVIKITRWNGNVKTGIILS